MLSETLQEAILYDKIYQYLWMKTDTSNPPPILIPETVIIRRSIPMFWYYSDRETLQIKKKKKDSVVKDKIRTSWLQRQGRSGVIACLLHFIQDLDFHGKPSTTFSDSIQIVYFDHNSFNDFMLNQLVDLPFGILQRFVEPGDEYNSEIQATWSRSLTLFAKRTSRKPLLQKKINVYERCCTFSGPDYFSEGCKLSFNNSYTKAQVKDFQSHRIQEQIGKMIFHLDDLSYGKLRIQKGTFYFKVDKWANCWFLFCGNLKFDGSKSKSVTSSQPSKGQMQRQSNIKIPKTIDSIMSVHNGRPLMLNKDKKCIVCEELDKDLKEVSYKFLIDEKQMDGEVRVEDEWPQELKEQAKEVKKSVKNQEEKRFHYVNTYSQIPIILEKIHHKLNRKNYNAIKDDFQFTNRRLLVCTNCYLKLSSLQQKLSLKEIRDNLEYEQFQQQQKQSKKVSKPQLHFLNVRVDEMNKRKEKNRSTMFAKPQSLSDTQRFSRRDRQTVKSYVQHKIQQLGFDHTDDRSVSKTQQPTSIESRRTRTAMVKFRSVHDVQLWQSKSTLKQTPRSPYLIKRKPL